MLVLRKCDNSVANKIVRSIDGKEFTLYNTDNGTTFTSIGKGCTNGDYPELDFSSTTTVVGLEKFEYFSGSLYAICPVTKSFLKFMELVPNGVQTYDYSTPWGSDLLNDKDNLQTLNLQNGFVQCAYDESSNILAVNERLSLVNKYFITAGRNGFGGDLGLANTILDYIVNGVKQYGVITNNDYFNLCDNNGNMFTVDLPKEMKSYITKSIVMS
jgi:hypothetical protein